MTDALMRYRYSNGRVSWYENDGAPLPTFISKNISNDMSGVHDVHTGDIDSDGNLDVLACSYTSGAVSWFEQVSSPTMAPSVIPTALPTELPSAVPTAVPTPVPTFGPTPAPTSLPTIAPTLGPTTTDFASVWGEITFAGLNASDVTDQGLVAIKVRLTNLRAVTRVAIDLPCTDRTKIFIVHYDSNQFCYQEGIASIIDGVSVSDISRCSVANIYRRQRHQRRELYEALQSHRLAASRHLTSSPSATISFVVQVALDTSSFADSNDLYATITSSLEIAAGNATSFIASIQVWDGVGMGKKGGGGRGGHS